MRWVNKAWVALCVLGLALGACSPAEVAISPEVPVLNEAPVLDTVVETAEPSPPEVLPDPVLPAVWSIPAGELLSPDHLGTELALEYFVVSEISDEIFSRMDGYSWTEGALPIDELRYLATLYWGFEGGTYVGEMVVNESIASETLAIFTELYEAQYEIALMVLIDDFSADDTASMEANNASAFNHRLIAGTNTLSKHALGIAIDINPIQNPWVRGNAVQPESGRPYVDRSLQLPHMIDHDDLAFQLFTAAGFTWGGDWTNPRDFHHFEK